MLLPVVLLALAVTVTDYGALLYDVHGRRSGVGERETRKLVRARASARGAVPRVCVNEIGGEHDSKRGESRIDRVARGWSNRRPTGWSVFYTGASCVERMRRKM